MAIHGPKNTVRFHWEDAEFPVMERDHFARDVLLGFLDLRLEEVLCLQDNPREKGYDVTFYGHSRILKMKELVGKTGLKEFPGLKITVLADMGYRKVTLHMFDPHVKMEDILDFLKCFGRVKPGNVEKVMDRTGFWTGKRTFHMILNEDPQGYDGLVHPPAFFTIGADRGYLSYYRQPPFCKKCRGSGHREKDCGEGAKCRFCSSKEHETKVCPKTKECYTCGSTSHLMKDCPRKGGSAGGGTGRGAETSGEKETSSEAAATVRAAKEGARTVSQAFNGAGAVEATSRGQKVRKKGDTEQIMDSTQSCGEWSGGGFGSEAAVALSYSSRQPSCLFGPASPAMEEESSPQRAEQKENEGPT